MIRSSILEPKFNMDFPYETLENELKKTPRRVQKQRVIAYDPDTKK